MSTCPDCNDGVAPYVGPPDDDHRAVCGYSHKPASPRCDRPAIRHLLVESGSWGTVYLATCAKHIGMARGAGSAVQEHEHALLCDLPGTIWDTANNRCVLDDRGVEPAQRATVGAGR